MRDQVREHEFTGRDLDDLEACALASAAHGATTIPRAHEVDELNNVIHLRCE